MLLATADNKVVGFKLGYEIDKQTFYSWLGAIHPDYQKLGIAATLMKRQHEWCKKSGYSFVETKTQNQYRDMLLLNIRFGFEITGTETKENVLKILLRKSLA